MINPPGRLLVVLGTRGMGDVVEVTAVIDLIKESLPQTTVHVGCHTQTQVMTLELVHHVEGSTRIVPGTVKHRWRALKNLRRNKRALEGYDAILFLYKKRVAWPLVWSAKLTGAAVYHAHDYHYRDRRRSAYSDWPEWAFFQLVASREMKLPLHRLREPRLKIARKYRQYADDFWDRAGLGSKPVVFMNTLGSATISDWPLDRFRDLANGLADAGASVIFNGGSPGQMEEWNALAPKMRDSVVLLERPDPMELAAVIAKCDLSIGTGSGPDSMAGAVGIKTITIEGPGEHGYPSQGRWGPVWWPMSARKKRMHKMDWCQATMGERCVCLYPPKKKTAKRQIKKVAKRLGLWKPTKKVLTWIGIRKKKDRRRGGGAAKGRGLVPCIDACTVEWVLDGALEHLGMSRQEVAQ